MIVVNELLSSNIISYTERARFFSGVPTYLNCVLIIDDIIMLFNLLFLNS